MRPTTVQLFYKKSIRLAPYNQAEVGVIITLEADPDAPVDPSAIADALQPAWLQVQDFVHAQEDVAIERYLELNPQEQLPRRNGKAGFTPVAAEAIDRVNGDDVPHPALTADDAFPARQGPTDAPPEAQEPAQAEAGFPARQAPLGPADAPQEAQEPAQAEAGFPARQEAEQAAGEQPAAGTKAPPRTPEEAERRYFARYAAPLGGADMAAVRAFFGDSELPQPATVDAWMALATRTRAEVTARQDAAEHETKVAQAKATLAKAEAAAASLAQPRPTR